MKDIFQIIKYYYSGLDADQKRQLVTELINGVTWNNGEERKIKKCIYCASNRIIKYGKNAKGKQRYQCKCCRRLSCSTTGTVMHNIKKKDKLFEYSTIIKEEGLKSLASKYMTKNCKY